MESECVARARLKRCRRFLDSEFKTMAMDSRTRGSEEARVRAAAFTLVEVVVALGLFSVGIVVVLRLFTGVSGAIRLNGETEAGIHAAEVLLARLRGRPFGELAGDLLTAEELQRIDSTEEPGPSQDRRLFFADAAADRIGQSGGPLWLDHEREKYFEIALVRDETLSPLAADELASCLAFTARIRWPASARRGAQRTTLTGSVFRGP